MHTCTLLVVVEVMEVEVQMMVILPQKASVDLAPFHDGGSKMKSKLRKDLKLFQRYGKGGTLKYCKSQFKKGQVLITAVLLQTQIR